jgi:hypothetical protein
MTAVSKPNSNPPKPAIPVLLAKYEFSVCSPTSGSAFPAAMTGNRQAYYT